MPYPDPLREALAIIQGFIDRDVIDLDAPPSESPKLQRLKKRAQRLLNLADKNGWRT